MDIKDSHGIALTILAMLCLAGMDATGKILVQDYPIVQILAVRFAIFFFIVLVIARLKGDLGSIRSGIFGTQLLRSIVLTLEVSVFIFAFSIMPLADVHAIAAMAPLIAILMAGWFLGEEIDSRSWMSVTIGFIGALIIIRPGLGVMSWQSLIPVCGAILWAAYQVLSRRVSHFDSPDTTVFYTASIGLIIFGGLTPFYWVEPSVTGWQLLIFNGFLGATGHYLLIKALALTPASILQPFSYALLFWAIIIGFVIFDELPDGMTLFGAIVILAAGVYASDLGRKLMGSSPIDPAKGEREVEH
ncbi:EamA/RhaT family transporter [Microbulbifer sp. A4B17]|uniref:DMT family transporter n=1 Tax=Microbulbifer sp. A4B17 TaxID=359370 RepID=UPI000D52E2A8|nr:DMT family transporter [Microbulbifer sp. A4B17]AWF80946.1 EamA/RhaT family transporter [Microbulbifer sp. A4B17]